MAKNIFSIIPTLVEVTTMAIANIKYIMKESELHNNNICEIIISMDIVNKLEIINLFIKEFNDMTLLDFQKKIIISLHEIIKLIQIELELIKVKNDYHKTKYFYSWRTFECSTNINNLKKYNITFDKRFEIMLKLFALKCNSN